MLPKIVLKKGKEKPLLRGHPWVFSGAVARMEGDPSPGEPGELYSIDGEFLGMGHINPQSQIVFRLLTKEREELGPHFFGERIRRASALRERWLGGKASGCRMVNGEGDFLPGLVVDRYGRTLVLQCHTAGMDRLREGLTEALVKDFHPEAIYERSDAGTRREEGLPEVSGFLYGKEISGGVEIEENGCRFRVDVKGGQKTGFYLDQRENRSILNGVSRGKRVLDCFCYTGAFSVHAGLGGAEEVTLVDSSREALERAEDHFELNDLGRTRRRLVQGDAFEVLRTLEPGYDIAILDPPPFAKKKGHVERASRGYKDLNLLALRLLKGEGLLFTFSCSHHIGWELFQKIVFSAAVDAGRRVQVLGRRGHPVDHPVDLCHPEGEYLKGLILGVW